MVNLTALENIQPFVLNASLVNDTSTLVPNLVSNTNTMTNNYWGLIVMASVYIYLLFLFTDKAGLFRQDFLASSVYSSGFALIIGSVMLVTDLTTTFSHVIWFGIIFTISILSSYIMKYNGG